MVAPTAVYLGRVFRTEPVQRELVISPGRPGGQVFTATSVETDVDGAADVPRAGRQAGTAEGDRRAHRRRPVGPLRRRGGDPHHQPAPAGRSRFRYSVRFWAEPGVRHGRACPTGRRSIAVKVRVRVLAHRSGRPPASRPRRGPCQGRPRLRPARQCAGALPAPCPGATSPARCWSSPPTRRRRRRSPPTCASSSATATARGPLARRVHYLPGWEVPPFEPLSPTREIVAARAEGLYHLLQTPDPVVVTTVEALGAARACRAPSFADAVTYVVAGETDRARRARRAARRVGLPPRAAGPGPGRPRAARRHPRRLPAGLRAAGAARVRRRRRSRASASSTRRRSARSTALEEVLLLPMREFGAARGSAPAPRASSTSAPPSSGSRARSAATSSRRCASGLVAARHRAAPALPLRRARARSPTTCPPDTLVWMQGAGEVEAAVEAAWAQVEEHAAEAARDGRFHPAAGAPLPRRPRRGARRSRAGRGSRSRRSSVLGGDGAARRRRYATDGLALRAARRRRRPARRRSRRGSREWQREGARLVLVAASAGAARPPAGAARRRTGSTPIAERRAVPAGARGAGPRRRSRSSAS